MLAFKDARLKVVSVKTLKDGDLPGIKSVFVGRMSALRRIAGAIGADTMIAVGCFEFHPPTFLADRVLSEILPLRSAPALSLRTNSAP